MNISPKNIAEGVNDLIYRLQKIGLVSDSRFHKVFSRSNGLLEVSWGRDGYILKSNEFSTLQEYYDLITKRQYSVLLSNGDFFQISYSTKRNRIVKHRLCWYPCPIALQAEELSDTGIGDAILDRMSGAKLQDFVSKSPIRFDYDSFNFSDDHPEIHMHLIDENCRIPVKTPLCLKSFLNFIFLNFYSEVPSILNLNSQTTTWGTLDRLTSAQKKMMHLNIFPKL